MLKLYCRRWASNMTFCNHFLTLVFSVSITFTCTYTLECYTCTNVTHISECKSTTTCNAGEICFSDYVQTQYGMLHSFGCRAETKCSTVVPHGNNKGSGSIVGRSAMTGHCLECCKQQHCNRQLCQHAFSEKECSDSTEMNCAAVGVMINICTDTQHAKTVCRRFCGLCSYSDGSWSSWFSWSNCDVTCGSGTQTRFRNCSEPAPSGGGQYCIGSSQDTQACTTKTCPEHGSWTGWTPWGSCSATCGIGLQRRDRSCSNPYPGPSGNHCFGDSRDDKICLSNACTDGGWADWSKWGACSATCGDGIKTRSRACSNPLPSLHGKYCQGDPYQVETCNSKVCTVIHGAWGEWSVWTSCTATCKLGIKSRHRDCDIPKPSVGGDYCIGSPLDISACNTEDCDFKNGVWSSWTTWSTCPPSYVPLHYTYDTHRSRDCKLGDFCVGKGKEENKCS